jgi:chromosomal replication initiation ATPase DnaA
MEEPAARREPGFEGEVELTFENFVAGDSSYIALAAAQEVSKFPGIRYNPLFIYCDVGQGKTHLLNAIGWEYRKRVPDGAVYLADGDELSEELEDTRDRRAFREKYSKPDLLLIDDFHLMTDAARTEIVRIFEALHSEKKQLVLASLRSPEELEMDERLRSRIDGGLVCKILPPDLDTRVAILKFKADRAGLKIGDRVLEEIANKVAMNVRKLEGAINRLVVLSRARGEEISVEFAASALRDMMPESPARRYPVLQEEPPEGGEAEFTDFVSAVTKTMSRISQEPTEDSRLKEAYAEKLYVWEMKGFKVDRLRNAFNKKIDLLARDFDSFTSDVQRLIELQSRFGALNARRFLREAADIERLLFDPDSVDDVARRIDELESKLARASPEFVEDYTFKRFLVESSNREAHEFFQSIGDSASSAPGLVFLWGAKGSGKTHLVNATAKELYDRGDGTTVALALGETIVDTVGGERRGAAKGRLEETYAEPDFLIVDDVQPVFSDDHAVAEFLTLIEKRLSNGKKSILVSDVPPRKMSRNSRFTGLVSKALVCELMRPADELKQAIALEYLYSRGIEPTDREIEELCESAGDDLSELKAKLEQFARKGQAENVLLEGTPFVEDRSVYTTVRGDTLASLQQAASEAMFDRPVPELIAPESAPPSPPPPMVEPEPEPEKTETAFAREEPAPAKRRSADEILDKNWELESDRLIESL